MTVDHLKLLHAMGGKGETSKEQYTGIMLEHIQNRSKRRILIYYLLFLGCAQSFEFL